MMLDTADDASSRVRITTNAPNEFAVKCVQRINPTGDIAEKHHQSILLTNLHDLRCVFDYRAGLVSPVRTAALGIEHIQGAAATADIHASINDRRLSFDVCFTGKCEYPFEAEIIDIAPRRVLAIAAD